MINIVILVAISLFWT